MHCVVFLNKSTQSCYVRQNSSETSLYLTSSCLHGLLFSVLLVFFACPTLAQNYRRHLIKLISFVYFLK